MNAVLLILILLVGLIPLVGLLVARTRVVCLVWAVLVTVVAYAVGAGLSSLITVSMTWDGEVMNSRPPRLALLFGVVAAVGSVAVALLRPGMARRDAIEGGDSQVQNDW